MISNFDEESRIVNLGNVMRFSQQNVSPVARGMVESQNTLSSALLQNCEWERFFQLFGRFRGVLKVTTLDFHKHSLEEVTRNRDGPGKRSVQMMLKRMQLYAS